MKKVIIIGGGIGGIATSILLAKKGYDVEIYEKNSDLGGRARQFKADGLTFDMGPSWYLMPGVFKHFYELIDEDINKHLKLKKLSPAYKVFFENKPPITVTGELDKDAETFNAIEPGAGQKLKKYINVSEDTYKIAVDNFLYTNFTNFKPILSTEVLKKSPFMAKSALTSIDSYVSSFFNDTRLKQIMEYPMVFLGSSPYNAPSIYNLMSYMDFSEGVYYPVGGLYEVIKSLISISKNLGVKHYTKSNVKKIVTSNGVATSVLIGNKKIDADIFISNADLNFTETKLLDINSQTYKETYWNKKEVGPSALLMYLGVKGIIPKLNHHNLFFVESWQDNFNDIFKNKKWPLPASIYVCNPSKTDKSITKPGVENIFVLVPGPATNTTNKELASLADKYLAQLEEMIGYKFVDKIIYKKLYGPNDFSSDYNSWQGTALGLSHSLKQSAIFRPKNISKKVNNLYYVGANTLPGIGLPMCLIGAELVFKRVNKINSSKPLKEL